MQTRTVELLGITKEDIQTIFQDTLRNFKESKTRVIYLDASYLYNFDLDDFEQVRKFNLLGRYYALKLQELSKQEKPNLIEYEMALADNSKYCQEWHNCLERWLSDQTVLLGGQYIKPIQIVRSFDRVVNEGLEELAKAVVGSTDTSFNFRGIGDGVVSEVLPSDKTLANEIDRIDVNTNKEGGSLSRDGSTIYSIGNHSKSVASASVTECGMFDNSTPATDKMFDHSEFETPVTHVQDSDAVGSTTIIYTCSA